ncbi:unnamed protein product, partial [Laminaria digitata]
KQPKTGAGRSTPKTVARMMSDLKAAGGMSSLKTTTVGAAASGTTHPKTLAEMMSNLKAAGGMSNLKTAPPSGMSGFQAGAGPSSLKAAPPGVADGARKGGAGASGAEKDSPFPGARMPGAPNKKTPATASSKPPKGGGGSGPSATAKQKTGRSSLLKKDGTPRKVAK